MRETERFTVREVVYDTGTPAFRVQGRMPDGRQIRRNVPTFHEALKVKEELELMARGQPVNFVLRKTRLTQEELTQAEQAFRKLRIAAQAHPHLMDKSLDFFVEFALAHYDAPTTRKIIREAIAEFKAAKASTKRRQRTLDDYDSRLAPLEEDHGDAWTDEITTGQLEALIDRTKSGRTQNHHRTKLHTFFKWCRKKGYCSSNPAEAIDIAEVDQPDPVILTLPQAEALLVAAGTHKQGIMVLYVVIGLFAGLRPAEIERLRWNMIDLKSKRITVTGGTAKRRKRRIVELSDNAVEWLIPLVGKPIFPKNFRRDFDAIRRLAGFKGSTRKKAEDESLFPWPHDVLRHTAISFHFAALEDEGKTAKWAGQSPDVMHTHYKGLVSKPDSQIFWGLKPTTINSEAPNAQQVPKLAD